MAAWQWEPALSCPACGLACFALMHVHRWCCENRTCSRQKAGSWLASAAPCGTGPHNVFVLLAVIFQLPHPPWLQGHGWSSCRARQRSPARHSTAVCHSHPQSCQYLSPVHSQMVWDSSCLQTWGCCSGSSWLCRSLGALRQPKPASPLGWQLQTQCSAAPQAMCLLPSAPPQPGKSNHPRGANPPCVPCAWSARFPVFLQTWALIG